LGKFVLDIGWGLIDAVKEQGTKKKKASFP